MDDPQAQIGLGLLAAGSPRADGAGFGQRLMEGVNAAQGMKRANTEQKVMDADLQQQQMQLQNMKNWQGMWAGDGGSSQVQPAQGTPVGGGLPQSAPQQSPQQPSQQPSQQVPGGVPLIPGLSYEESRNAAIMLGPQGYMKAYLDKAGAQTDFVKNLVAAGIDPKTDIGRQLIQQNIYKSNNIPLVAGRAGAPMYNERGEVVSMAPKIPDNAVPIIQNGQVVGVRPLQGASDVEQINAYAGAAGRNQAEPQIAYDDQGNAFYTNKLSAATSGGAPVTGGPAPVRNNNPGALMPGGKLAQFGSMDQGLAALDNNLKNYGMKGVNTLAGVITKWAPPNENDTAAYISDVSKRLGIDPNQPINLSNPAVRQAIGTGIMFHENGVNGVFGNGGSAVGKSPMRAGPPVGATNNVQLMQNQGSELLKNAQADAAANRQTSAYFDEIDNLLNSGAKFGPMSADIARWKALVPGIDLSGAMTNQDVMRKLAANLAGARGTRSDADLANWSKAYPNGEMTNQAIKEVLPMLRNTLSVSDARAKVITNASSSGLENIPKIANDFNQIASPSLVSAGQQLAAASRTGQTRQFIAQFKAQYPNDWQQRLQSIQQLDKMGAF
ncbi:hypothetical protein [Rhodoferax sp. GW822-FHT02A01]|uniref:hypothetical protein n=1 Tax=Rhodoferax sp. GW822-FHT02A01 TaxID=3141537 RepID=UPI00315DDAA1